MSVFEKILLASDGSECAGLAAQMAAEISGKLGSELHLASAAPLPVIYGPEAYVPSPDDMEMLNVHAEREARSTVEAEEERLREMGVKVSGVHPSVGRADEQIVDLAESLPASLIVVGSRGLGRLKRVLLGSVSESVLRHAHCPVLVVRGRQGEGDFFPTRILLAADGSKESAAAARTAAGLAKETGSELYLVHVIPALPPQPYPYYSLESQEERLERTKKEVRKFLDKRAEQLESEFGSRPRTHLRVGDPRKEIVELSDEIDAGLVVLGSRGYDGLSRVLIGSVSEGVVRHARCPVLVVRDGKLAEEAGFEENTG